MKLNLLPQTVSKGRALKTGYVVGGLIFLGTVLACGYMKLAPLHDLQAAQDRVDNSAQGAADAVATGAQKDTVIATASTVIRNASLAQALIGHNDVYPDLYTEVLGRVPGFFRLTSISAQPVDGTTATVTLVGTVGSYAQYADLMLALSPPRLKDVTSISRTGFVLNPVEVPALTTDDQKGIPHKPGEATLPEGQVARLNYHESQNYQPKGYLALNGYGSGGPGTKGPSPDESLVTIVLTMKRNLQVPDIAKTLQNSGGGGASAPAAGFGMPSGPGMGGPGGPGGLGGPGGVPSGAARGGGGSPLAPGTTREGD